jgi:hypothetical protein
MRIIMKISVFEKSVDLCVDDNDACKDKQTNAVCGVLQFNQPRHRTLFPTDSYSVRFSARTPAIWWSPIFTQGLLSKYDPYTQIAHSQNYPWESLKSPIKHKFCTYPVVACVYNVYISRFRGVTIDGVWIRYWIFWPLVYTTGNYM